MSMENLNSTEKKVTSEEQETVIQAVTIEEAQQKLDKIKKQQEFIQDKAALVQEKFLPKIQKNIQNLKTAVEAALDDTEDFDLIEQFDSIIKDLEVFSQEEIALDENQQEELMEEFVTITSLLDELKEKAKQIGTLDKGKVRILTVIFAGLLSLGAGKVLDGANKNIPESGVNPQLEQIETSDVWSESTGKNYSEGQRKFLKSFSKEFKKINKRWSYRYDGSDKYMDKEISEFNDPEGYAIQFIELYDELSKQYREKDAYAQSLVKNLTPEQLHDYKNDTVFRVVVNRLALSAYTAKYGEAKANDILREIDRVYSKRSIKMHNVRESKNI